MQILLLLLHVWSIRGWNRLRLQGGEGPCAGRVEVFHDNAWGVVCNHKWQRANDEVVCRSLGCGVPRGSSTDYTIPDVPRLAWMNEVNCTGTESSLWDCTFPGWGVNKCPTEQHINIECSENVSLTLEHGCAGAVQYTTSKGKGVVCHANWGKKEADLVCRELNCGVSTYVPLAGTYRAQGPALISSLNCTGDETFLWQCVARFGAGEACADPVGVVCLEHRPLRLTGGPHSCSGRLEVRESGAWRPICRTDHRLLSAGELCSRLRCGEGGRLEPGPCNGTGQVNLTCSDAVKVVLLDGGGKESRCFGAVHVDRNGTREAVCGGGGWTEEQSGVVCRELGCGGALTRGGRARDGGVVVSGRLSRVQCPNAEDSLWHCLARTADTAQRCQGAYVVCEGSVDVRLVDGSGRCSGRVEVLYEGTWKSAAVRGGTNELTAAALDALCGKLNCGKMHRHGSDLFSHGDAAPWQFTVSCRDVFSPRDCFKFEPYRSLQKRQDSTKVICAEDKMLYLLGETPCSGKVGIQTAGRNYWLAGSPGTWRNDTAAAVCRQMQCGSALSFKTVARDAGDSQEAWKSTYSCSSNETSLFDCTPEANKNDSEIAFVHCSGSKSASLEEGCWGKLRVCVGESCGGVCADAWTREHADAVCQELGCGKALPAGPASSKAPGTLFLSAHCAKPARNLTQCSFIPARDHTYCQQNPVYVTCSGSLRAKLVDPQDRCAGNVEMFLSGSWYPVCKEALGGANVRGAVCKEAGCGRNSTFGDSLYRPAGARGISDIECTGNNTLKECLITARPKDCVLGRLQCSGRVSMLLGDGGACKGRVFVLAEGGDQYPVAVEGWGVPEGKVLCRYLRCGDFVRQSGERSLLRDWWAVRSRCLGNETSIWDCVTVARAAVTPAKSRQLHVECTDTPILSLSGKHQCSGRVEIDVGGQRGGVCGQHWGEKESRVVCQELNCSHAISHEIERGVRREATYVSCSGKESKLWQCGTKSEACESGLVSVTCADDVQFSLTEKCGGEVKMYYWGQWESVCPLPSPTSKEARLICARLGCGDAVRGEEPTPEAERKNMRASILCAGSEKLVRHCVRPLSCTAQRPAFVYCQGYVNPEFPANPAVVILLLTILVLAAALVIWLWLCRVRHLKTGAMSAEVLELATRVLPKVPESTVEVDIEASHGASSSSEYDDIEDEAANAAAGAARLLGEELATHEQRETLENMASATGREAESQEDYDDVIELPLVREPQCLRNYENTSERKLSNTDSDDFLQPIQHGSPVVE